MSHIHTFEKHFGSGTVPAHYFCPGRINLIGEHIDYNGGFVFPAALTIGIGALIRLRTDGIFRFASETLPGLVEIRPEKGMIKNSAWGWANYPIGVLIHLMEDGHHFSGADVLFYSNLPDGAGVSSSAAIEVLTGYMLLDQIGQPVDRVWLARFAQGVENRFIGVNCGIMDQFAVANGKAGMGMVLNCNNLDFSYVPVDLGEYRIVILNTNKRRELAESKYNERRSECEAALSLLAPEGEWQDLCSVPVEKLPALTEHPVLQKRARHVVLENQRVLESVQVLKDGDLVRFGALLNESHFSLKNDYEVTGKELDAITEAARQHPACMGARMTGAGFGGCGIALVREDGLDDFCNEVAGKYQEETGLTAGLYVSAIGDGVHKIQA